MYKTKNIFIASLFILIIISFTSCKTGPFEDSDFLLLASYMTGDFDSEAQHDAHPTQFHHVDVRMKRIWADDTDCVWMYVEQGLDGYAPYRQRVYKLDKLGENEFVSKIYEFKSPTDETNAIDSWQEEDPLSDLTESSFNYKDGCDVFISKQGDGSFFGETIGKDCTTEYPPSDPVPCYTTTEVTITSEYMESEDKIIKQSDDVQIGGSFNGPYMFDKLENFDEELNP
jgi:CpeT protein